VTRVRLATYNIHKGVQGLGPNRRLEIHNLGHAVEQFEADIICLQEVRKMHRREAAYFAQWPQQAQADFLAPEGYHVVYRTNAITRHGEHGNAVLSCWPVLAHQHEDMSDHRFEQRGLLHVPVRWNGLTVHAVVVHFGLVHSSRLRQVERLARFIASAVPPGELLVVAGDFNDWGERLDGAMAEMGVARAVDPRARRADCVTFPSLAPVFALDRFYLRGLACSSTFVPRGSTWARMSDHLPLVAELRPT
jgi:endonuclease/exonuclease/phosphatase family metal-dependent hydrolase